MTNDIIENNRILKILKYIYINLKIKFNYKYLEDYNDNVKI